MRTGLGAVLFCVALAAPPAYAGSDGASVVLAPAQDTGSVDLRVQPSAPAQRKTVAVLVLSGEEAGLPLSDVYDAARRGVEGHTALDVAPLDAIGLAEREAAIRECAGKAACFARKVRTSAAAAELLLTVSVDRLDEGLLLGLRLVDVQSEQELGATGDEIPVGMSLIGAMEDQLQDVFPSSVWDEIGNVSVQTEPANAEVAVAGRTCVSPCELERVVPGTYQMTVKKSGYVDYTTNVTVNAQETAEVSAILEEPEGGIVSSPWLWIGVGAAVIGAGVATAFLLQPDDRVVNVCIADDPSQCQ